jgi:Mn-dependent DtxR family transcriptional regulator
MTTPPPEEVKQKIIQHLQRVKQAPNRDIAKAAKIDKHLIDKTITELINDGTLMYVNYGGVTYVAIASKTDKSGAPETT